MADEYKLKTIVLRDLEPLLRENIDERLIVDSFTTESLLPPGENYGSTILSVHAVIRKNEDAPKEDLFLIAKMSPPTDYQKRIFDSAYTFRKETHMYVDILPEYNKFEIECGIKEDQVFDILPKFYGMRLSLDPKSDLDDDAVILLENLKKKGYYIGKRAIGYDYEHTKLVIHAMARFHVLGMAMKYKRPEAFKVFVEYSKCLNLQDNEFKTMNDTLKINMQEDPMINPVYERCEKILNDISIEEIWTGVPEEPWSTITHSDFWVNNIMFHRGEDGRLDDIKFVDFQNYLFSSPLRELVFYLFSSGDEDVRTNHLDEFIDMYYERFIGHLKRFGCDTTPFSREKFDKQLKVDAQCEFMHLAFMMKVLTLNTEESNFNYDDMKDLVVGHQGCDYEHSKVFIQASARFHAIGMALKYKKPEVFQILRQHTKCFNLITPDLDVKKDLLEYINDDPILKSYRDRCDKAFGELSMAEIWRLVPEEPWSTIVHGDSWVNNIMFHRGENGRVDDVKFVDFQNYLFANPISELIFYLFSSGDEDVQKNHIEELMDLYYDCFICHLTRFGCDTTPFAREKFNDQLRVNSQLVFMHLAFMMKVLTMNIEEIDFNYDKIQNLIMDYQGNPLYIKRLRILVLDFVDRNWI